MIEFSYPFSFGEWLAWWAAVYTLLYGLFCLAFPYALLRLLGLGENAIRTKSVAEIRSSGGMRIGLALAAILLAQPLIYLALGTAYIFGLMGRIVSLFTERTFGIRYFILILMEIGAAGLLFAFGLQIIP